MASTPGGSSTGGRNWPLIVALLAAFALVFAVLPNPFRIPSDEPTTAAEFAPVPGKKEQSTQTGSFASVGFAEGGGFGAPPPPPPPPPPIDPKKFRGRHRNVPPQLSCVKHADGKYHQTNDPLSPICVPYWDGQTKTSRAPGVTDDEITVVLYADNGPADKTDLNTEYRTSEEPACPPYAFECRNIVRTMKAHLRYHQERYQTYGRTVHVIVRRAASGCPGTNCTPAARRGDAIRIVDENDPFAVLYFGDHAGAFWDEMAKNKRAVFGVNFSVDKKVYEENKPYAWSFMPDVELETRNSAGFLCRKIIGGDTRLTRDPRLKGQPRKIALVYEIDADGDIKPHETQAVLREELKRQCGFEFARIINYDTDDPTGGGDATAQIATLQNEDITTIVCYCLPGQYVTSMQQTATDNGYFPEWYWDQASAMDRVIWQEVYWDKQQANFGSSYFWRQPAFREQFHYKAYLAEEPGTTPNVRFNFRVYYMFQNLFSGIQGAGPDLDAGWAERGMFTFHQRLDRRDPWVPFGGFGRDGPSPYTFIETSEGFWRDPQGTAPGGKQGAGCMRVIQGGARFDAGSWTKGDDDLADLEEVMAGNRGSIQDPCTEDIYRLEDPQAGDGI